MNNHHICFLNLPYLVQRSVFKHFDTNKDVLIRMALLAKKFRPSLNYERVNVQAMEWVFQKNYEIHVVFDYNQRVVVQIPHPSKNNHKSKTHTDRDLKFEHLTRKATRSNPNPTPVFMLMPSAHQTENCRNRIELVEKVTELLLSLIRVERFSVHTNTLEPFDDGFPWGTTSRFHSFNFEPVGYSEAGRAAADLSRLQDLPPIENLTVKLPVQRNRIGFVDPLKQRNITIHGAGLIETCAITDSESSEITLMDSQLSLRDLNDILRKWKAGRMNNLEKLVVECPLFTTVDALLDGIEPVQTSKPAHKLCNNIMSVLSWFHGFDVKTNDGSKTATIIPPNLQPTFELYVWNL